MTSYGHLYLQLSEQAIEAQGEACSNAELFRRVAARMGLDEACLRASDDEMIDDVLSSGHPFLEGITRAALEDKHWMELKVLRDADGAYLPFAHGFATPGGKAELYSEALAAAGVEPVAAYKAPVESRHSPEVAAISIGTAGAQARQFSQHYVLQSGRSPEDGEAL